MTNIAVKKIKLNLCYSLLNDITVLYIFFSRNMYISNRDRLYMCNFIRTLDLTLYYELYIDVDIKLNKIIYTIHYFQRTKNNNIIKDECIHRVQWTESTTDTSLKYANYSWFSLNYEIEPFPEAFALIITLDIKRYLIASAAWNNSCRKIRLLYMRREHDHGEDAQMARSDLPHYY